ncbi:MAG: helix-turn-helix domain-containing protein [Candidatus Rariloculaceae bacterium]
MRRHENQSANAERPSGEYPSVGEMLRNAREALNFEIDQVAGDLRIDGSYLIAMEDNDFDKFSAPVFAKGYLRQYALRLGLDDKELLTLYYRQVGAVQMPKLKVQTIEMGEDRRQARWLVAGSVIVLVVASVSIWQFNTLETEIPVVTTVESTSEREPGQAMTLLEQPIVIVTAPINSGTVDEIVSEPIEALPEVIASELQVEIIFREDCWTEVIDVLGERLFYGLGRAGARSRFAAAPPLSLFLGNASGVDISVDGIPYEISGENRQGNLARFMILGSGD